MRLVYILVPALIAAGAIYGQDAKSDSKQSAGDKASPKNKPNTKGTKENHTGGEGGKETRIVFPLPDGPRSTPSAIYVSAADLSLESLSPLTSTSLELGRTVMLRGTTLDPGTKVQLKVVQIATPKGSSATLEAETVGSNSLTTLALSEDDVDKARKALSAYDLGALNVQNWKNLSVVYLACQGEQLVTLEKIAKGATDNIKFCARYEIRPAKHNTAGAVVIKLAEKPN